MAARWFEVKRAAEPASIWAPPGAPYLININHPLMREEYERAKRAFGVPHIYPMSDAQRWVWEMDVIRRYCGRQTPSGAARERRKRDYPSDELLRPSASECRRSIGSDTPPDKGSPGGSIPAHVIYRLKVPPYKGLWETTPSTAVRRSLQDGDPFVLRTFPLTGEYPSLDEGGEDVGIKKDRRIG